MEGYIMDRNTDRDQSDPMPAKQPHASSRSNQDRTTAKKSGLKWLLSGGIIIGAIAICGVILFGLLLTISSGQISSQPQVAQAATDAPEVFQATNTRLPSPTSTPIPDTPTAPAKTETPALSPTIEAATGIPVPELGFSYGTPGLYASDPDEFIAAAGKPQFVELFAFW
jgi:hypothetical protein